MGKKIDEMEDESSWEEDDEESDAEVIKLKVGDSIEGILTDKIKSHKYETMCYKIKVKDDELSKVIVGTTLLVKRMENKEIGDEIKIERIGDTTNAKGQAVQNFKTYHKKGSDGELGGEENLPY